MKKVINGKRYDTDTAKEMGMDSYSNRSDFSYWKEILYRKNTGEFFLWGEGGPRSKYVRQIDNNNWMGGEKITPLSYNEAMSWAEEHLSGEEYEAIFGEIQETTEKDVVALSLPISTIELLKRKAAADGKNLSDFVTKLINEA